MKNNYLSSIDQSFRYYKLLGDKSFAQLSDADLFFSPSGEDNSIGILVKHLWGNMLSRWTNFLTEDGEKQWRKREDEFERDIKNREELLSKWNEGWTCVFEALSTIDEDNFSEVVYIRNQGHTIVEACNRQLAHYAYHVGQIVFLAKMIKKEDWQSLSIPKGDSKKFNEEKFSQEKRIENFTQDYIENKKSDS